MGVENRRLRHTKYQEADRRAREEIKTFWLGERSAVFFPAVEPAVDDVTAHVLFEAPRIEKVISADLAKKRAIGINSMLEHPQDPRSPEAFDSLVTFMHKNWERIRKYGRTLRNKGRLSSVAEHELGL